MLTVDFMNLDIYSVLKENYQDDRIQKILDSLPEEEKQVLDDRIGINGEKMTRNAIATKMGITLDRVRGIEERALKHLKHPARFQYINEVLDPNFHASEKAHEFFNSQNKKM